GVGVLVERQARRGVLDEDMQQADLRLPDLRQRLDNAPRDEVKPPRHGRQVECRLGPRHGAGGASVGNGRNLNTTKPAALRPLWEGSPDPDYALHCVTAWCA